MNINEDDYISHYGIIRRSGRYPWGSGGHTELQDASSFLDYVEYLKKKFGLSDTEVARDLGISTTRLRAKKSIAKNEQKQAQIIEAQRYKDKGYSNGAIAERMGLAGESSVRALLAPGAKDKADLLTSTANMLKKEIAEKKYIDVGTGVEHHIGVSDTKLKTAVAMLEEEGYKLQYVKVPQLGTGKETTVKVLTKDDVPYSELYKNRGQIQQVKSFSDDGGRSFATPTHDPIPVDPKRVEVNYAEDGGDKADGVIYVRPGVKDVSLGAASYAQVRIKVGDNHYLKGMAMYKDDLPEGVDLLFNTNKSKSEISDKLEAMKELSDDPDLPFGAVVRQIVDNPGTPEETPTSAMNIVNEEGNWEQWSRNLSPQMLAKQKPALVREQLNLTYDNAIKEFEQINALTNPTVRRKLLEEFADGTDASAVHLKAAALPRQGSHVILPVNSLTETEIYAPNFLNGETVVLIRYPHGGTFEIPQLQVNNNHPESKKLLGQARDAVGINSKVAEQLSGADFDGDTVLVIPNSRGKVSVSKALTELKDFDPRSAYPGYEGMKPMTNKQTEMGKVSNLITDMTIKGAPHKDIARAVKHSMVVIDAEKHGLNYKKSEIDNGIRQLREKYQRQEDGKAGAATLISRAKSPRYIPDRKERPAAEGGPVDKETGKKVFVETGKVSYKTGKPVRKRHKALEVTDDARTLSSGQPVENTYADHSNRLKDLANRARREAVNTPRAEYSPSAKRIYQREVDSLNSKLRVAQRNKPLERQAQVLANAVIKAKRDANPTMDKDTEKKLKFKALDEARKRTGAGKERIDITPEEWDAIQSGAISDSKLSSILSNANMDIVREFATPRPQILMTPARTSRARDMLDRGHTRADVARALGVSLTTLDVATNE